MPWRGHASPWLVWTPTLHIYSVVEIVRCSFFATTYKIFDKILVHNDYIKMNTTYIIDKMCPMCIATVNIITMRK
jgi:hypothetical protein